MSDLARLLVFFVDDDKKKNKFLEASNAIKKKHGATFVMIFLELPWGWDILVSQNLYDHPEYGNNFRNLLDKILTNGIWHPEQMSSFPDFWLIKDAGDMHKSEISRIFTELEPVLEITEEDLRETAIIPSKLDKKTEGKPKKKTKKREKRYFDGKMASAGERVNDD